MGNQSKSELTTLSKVLVIANSVPFLRSSTGQFVHEYDAGQRWDSAVHVYGVRCIWAYRHPSGSISGTPSTAGLFWLQASLTDSAGNTQTEQFPVEVMPSDPTGLSHTSVRHTGWTESWTAVSGATGYNVYVGGMKVTTSPVTGTTYNVANETAGKIYSVTVTAVNTGGESAQSSPDSVMTLPNVSGSQ